MTTGDMLWTEANQRYLTAALAGVRAHLVQQAARNDTPAHLEAPGLPAADDAGVEFPADQMPPPALETLCAAFGLSLFERQIVLLCAGVELDARFSALCAAAQGDPARAYPTFSLALAALEDPHWSAVTPGGPAAALALDRNRHAARRPADPQSAAPRRAHSALPGRSTAPGRAPGRSAHPCASRRRPRAVTSGPGRRDPRHAWSVLIANRR